MRITKLQDDIRRLLKEKEAILLAHNYQRAEIQDIADLTGDSLELSVKAAAAKAKVILFCGVHFMAESASVLCPERTVLLANREAGCPMADMITKKLLLERRRELNGVPVVTYVNSTAEVKAESDICCTSANVIRVVNSLTRAKQVLMTPDKNLALYAARHTEKELLLWPGYCPVHDSLSAEQVLEAKASHPEALVVAHPECRPVVLAMADEIRSTTGMLGFCKESKKRSFIICTEQGILHPLRVQNPGKEFISPSDGLICPDMKVTTLEDVLETLETMRNVVKVPDEVGVRARKAIDRMLAVPRD